MSISTLESPASRRALDATFDDAQEADRLARVAILTEQFLKAAAEAQADKFVMFAPRRRDCFTGERRFSTVADLLDDARDYRGFGQRAAQVLLNAAAGRGTQREAQQLLAEIAAHWADMEVES